VGTPLIPSTMAVEKAREFGANTAFGRAGQPVELAPLFVFLASNESRFVTGEVYGATGGRRTHLVTHGQGCPWAPPRTPAW
jgi:NAD(P)-dependent dehydrogenase (short-subunit alcohol dehydrogenase family)